MWESQVSSAQRQRERQLEAKLLQQQLIDNSSEQKSSDEAALSASRSDQRWEEQFADLAKCISKEVESRWQESWLRTGRENSKAAGAQFISEGEGNGAPVVSAAGSTRSGARLSAGVALTAASSAPASSAASVSAAAQRAAPAVAAQAPLAPQLPVVLSSSLQPTGNASLPSEVAPSSTGVASAASKTNSLLPVDIPFAGIQPATKQTPPMSAFSLLQFGTSSDSRRQSDTASRQEAAEALAAAGYIHARRGALIETPEGASYKTVALQENFMPRLYELVQKLSSMGQSWARVVIPVDAQTKVIVRFCASAGRVKIHMSSSASGLSDMIKAGWSWLTGQSAQHGISIDEPTFDTNDYVN